MTMPDAPYDWRSPKGKNAFIGPWKLDVHLSMDAREAYRLRELLRKAGWLDMWQRVHEAELAADPDDDDD
jgi:hypothetical protein